MSKIRFGFSFESYQFQLFNLDYRPKGDCIIAFPFTKSGLHISLHASGKAHIKDDFELYEPLNFDMPKSFDINELKRCLRKMTYNPDHGENVLVLSYPENYEYPNQKNVNLDLISVIKETLIDTPFYLLPVESLPRYFQTSPLKTHIIIDETANSFVFHNTRKRTSLNFSMEESIMKQIETMPFLKQLMQPVRKAIDHTDELVCKGRAHYKNIP